MLLSNCRLLQTGAVALLITVVACGGDVSSSTPATGATSSSPSVASSTAPVTTESQPETTTAPPTTVPATTAGSGSPEFGSEEFGLTMEQLVTRIEQVEALIGDCMREAGFEYVPVDFDTVRRAMIADKSAPGLSDDDYLAQYGYGISTQFDDPSITLGFGDQNRARFDNLSGADQVAYKRTLWGANPDVTFAVALEAEDFSQTGGCTRTAVEHTFTPEEMSATYFNPGDLVLEQDPRVVEAIAAWSECVRAAGFDYSHPDQIEEDIKERFDAITEGADPLTLSGSAQEALVQLQGEERAVAQVDFDCAETLLEPVVDQVEAEIYGAPQG